MCVLSIRVRSARKPNIYCGKRASSVKVCMTPYCLSLLTSVLIRSVSVSTDTGFPSFPKSFASSVASKAPLPSASISTNFAFSASSVRSSPASAALISRKTRRHCMPNESRELPSRAAYLNSSWNVTAGEQGISQTILYGGLRTSWHFFALFLEHKKRSC